MFSSKNPAGEKAPSKQGFLLKRGEKGLKQMKQRWFALEMNTLSYYKNNRLNSAPLGFISLSQVTSVAPSKKDEEGTFEIKMENEGDKEGRTYVLRARTTSEMEEWIAVINESKAYYERGGLASAGASSVESAEGNLKLQLQHKEREIEALARSLKLTKDLLEKEKRRCALILETERAEANKIRDAQKELAAEASSLKAQIADKDKQLAAFKEVMDKSDSKEDQLRVHTLTISKKPEDDLKEELECRTEELKEVKQKVKEKKERIRDLKKQLATANEVFNITKAKSGGSAMDSENSFTRSVSATTNSLSDSDSVFLLREKMSEMKETLESRIEELQEKLEGQIAENHKLESDAAQWKGMAQKELKARLNLETEKASLQRELNESRRNLDSYRDSGRSKSSSSSREGSSRDNSSNEYVVPDYSKSPKASSGYHPLIEEGSAADSSSRGGGKATNNPNCWSCSIQ